MIQNSTDETYYYARYDEEGRAAPTSMKVGGDHDMTDLSTLAEANSVALAEMARRLHEGIEGPSGRGAARSVRSPSNPPDPSMPPDPPDSLIVILVEFSDVKHQNPNDWPLSLPANVIPDNIKSDYSEYTEAEFDSMLFGASYTGTSPDGDTVYGSMREYWEDMSNGTYTLKGRVANDVRDGIPVWITLGQTKAHYANSGGDARAVRNSRKEFRKAALDSANAQQGIDISMGSERKICIIYAGNMYLNGLWPHASAGDLYIINERYHVGDVYPNPRNAEINNANFTHIGVHCHEFGHILGADDHYRAENSPYKKWDYTKWGLMATGGNNEVAERGDSPAPMSPQLRAGLGWITPTIVSNLMEGEMLSYTSNMDDVYKIGNSEDFFLIENRQTGRGRGWNRALPHASGLLIWHVRDGHGFDNDIIDLVEADTSIATGTYGGDPFPGSGDVRSLTDFTTPSSNKYFGGNSNVLVTDIKGSGTDMTADLSPYWWGTLDSTTTWSGGAVGDTVKVGADVTISSGDTLTISPGTLVRFTANSDDLGGLPFADKSVLKVNGTLVAGRHRRRLDYLRIRCHLSGRGRLGRHCFFG